MVMSKGFHSPLLKVNLLFGADFIDGWHLTVRLMHTVSSNQILPASGVLNVNDGSCFENFRFYNQFEDSNYYF